MLTGEQLVFMTDGGDGPIWRAHGEKGRESMRLISGENLLFVKIVQAKTILPHDFALGVQSDPR